MFRRAFNVLTWLILYAQRKDIAPNPAPTPEDLKRLDRNWYRVNSYAKALNEGLKSWRTRLRQEIKNYGTEAEYRRQRAASREHNFERHRVSCPASVYFWFHADFFTILFFQEHMLCAEIVQKSAQSACNAKRPCIFSLLLLQLLLWGKFQ